MMGLPNCRKVAAELSREQDTPGHGARRRSVRLHLLMCRHCRRYAHQLTWLAQAMSQVRSSDAGAAKLPAVARARIHDRLRREASRPPV